MAFFGSAFFAGAFFVAFLAGLSALSALSDFFAAGFSAGAPTSLQGRTATATFTVNGTSTP